MNPEDKIKKLIDKSKIKTDAQTENKILSDAFEHLEKFKQQKSPSFRPNIWRTIMKNKKTRVAAMVAIIFVITIVIFQFDQTSTALAQVKTAIHERLLRLKELVTETKQTAPSPSNGQRGSGGRRGRGRKNENPDTLSKQILINLLYLSIEGKQENLNDFFNKEKIKLNMMQNNPEAWYTKLASSQIERFREFAYTIDNSELRGDIKIGVKDGQEGVIRSTANEEVFVLSVVADILDDSNDIELSCASLFGQSEIEIPGIKTKSDEAVLLCLTTQIISKDDRNNPQSKISTLVMVQTQEELTK